MGAASPASSGMPPDDAMPAEAGPSASAAQPGQPAELPPARRFTGAQLYRHLTSSPEMRARIMCHDLVPLVARQVLGAFCAIVARMPEAGEFRPRRDMAGEEVDLVCRELKIIRAAAEVATAFDALIRVGLVIRLESGAVALPIDVAAITAHTPGRSSATATGASGSDHPATPGVAKARRGGLQARRGGRPKKNETAEEAYVRRDQEERERKAGNGSGSPQRPLPLVRTHTGCKPLPETSSGNPPETSSKTPPETQKPKPEVSEKPVSEVSRAGFGTLSSNLAAAAAVREGVDLIEQQQQQLEQPRTCTEISRARETSETGNLETSRVSVSTGEVSRDTVASGQAFDLRDSDLGALALQVARALGIQGVLRGRSPAELLREWLALPGITPDVVLTLARNRGQQHQAKQGQPGWVPIGSFNFLDDAVRERAGLPNKVAAQISAAATAAPTTKPLPRLLERPGMEAKARLLLTTALDPATRERPEVLAGTLRRLQAYPQELAALLRHSPELRATG